MRRAVALLLGLGLVAGLASCTTQVDGYGSLPDPHDIVLQTKDLPAWDQSRDPSKDDNDPALDAKLAKCMGPTTYTRELDSADSPDFERGEAFISSSASVMSSAADVQADTRVLTRRETEPCIEQAFIAYLKKDFTGNDRLITASFRLVPRHAGQPSRLVRLGVGAFSVVVSGHAFTFYFDMAFLAAIRTEAIVVFGKLGQRFTTAFENQVMTTVASRLG